MASPARPRARLKTRILTIRVLSNKVGVRAGDVRENCRRNSRAKSARLLAYGSFSIVSPKYLSEYQQLTKPAFTATRCAIGLNAARRGAPHTGCGGAAAEQCFTSTSNQQWRKVLINSRNATTDLPSAVMSKFRYIAVAWSTRSTRLCGRARILTAPNCRHDGAYRVVAMTSETFP